MKTGLSCPSFTATFFRESVPVTVREGFFAFVSMNDIFADVSR